MLFEYFVDLQSEAGERTRRSQQRQVEGRIKKKIYILRSVFTSEGHCSFFLIYSFLCFRPLHHTYFRASLCLGNTDSPSNHWPWGLHSRCMVRGSVWELSSSLQLQPELLQGHQIRGFARSGVAFKGGENALEEQLLSVLLCWRDNEKVKWFQKGVHLLY